MNTHIAHHKAKAVQEVPGYAHSLLLHVFHNDAEIAKYAMIAFGLVIVIGIFLGLKKKIAVYESGDDILLCMVTLAAPMAEWMVANWLKVETGTVIYQIAKWASILLEICFAGVILKSTWKANNGSIWRFVMALVTKLTLCSALWVNLAFLIASLNSNKHQNTPTQRADYSGLIGMLLSAGGLAFLMVRLIKRPDILPIQADDNEATRKLRRELGLAA